MPIISARWAGGGAGGRDWETAEGGMNIREVLRELQFPPAEIASPRPGYAAGFRVIRVNRSKLPFLPFSLSLLFRVLRFVLH